MKERYKYIHFVKVRDDNGIKVWSCRNNHSGEELGTVVYYDPWRQYVYQPTVQAVYSEGCLTDIADFLKQLKGENKDARRDQ